MIKKLIFITILFFFTSNAFSQIINEVKIEGNNRISKETIFIYGEIELNKDYSEDTLDKIIKNLYSTNFFEDISVKIKNNILEIKLKEYPVINKLIFIGEKKKTLIDQIKKVISSKEKNSFIKSSVIKDIEIIKKLYSSIGYNFAKAEVKINEIANDKVDMLIEINRGERTKISKINFIGNENVSTRRLTDVIASQEDKFWKIISKNTNLSENLVNLDVRLITNYYKSVGFYDVKVSSNLAKINFSGEAQLVYSIDEGKRYTINKISTNVDSVFDKKLFFPLRKSYDDLVGSYYSPFKVKKLLDELDELINRNSLQFVEHNVQETIEGDTINIILNVFEGEKTLVERINITGNNVTNENVIRGELILDEGDPLTNINLEKSISKIKSRNIFTDVKYEINDGSKDNLKIIDINVEEKPTGEISAGAGIGTNGGSFAFNIRENNWLGEGKNVAFEIEVDQETLEGTFSFTDPNYDFLGNSLSYSLSSQSNDKPDQGYENSIISANISTAFEQYKNIFASLGLGFSYDDLRTDSSASSSLKKQAGTFSEVSANYGFAFDDRDRTFMPTSGSILRFNQSLPFYADKSYIDNTLSISAYKTLSENFVGATKFYITAIEGLDNDDVRLSKRKGLSSRRLRGFERNKVGPVDSGDHVGGNYASSLNFETNLPNLLPENTKTDVSLFLDFANVWGVDYDSSLDDGSKIRSSTGAIFNWISPVGPLTFTFSQNLAKAETDKTESFTFNLGTSF